MVAVYILQIFISSYTSSPNEPVHKKVASYLAKITSQKGHFNDDTFIYQTKHLHPNSPQQQ